jgi:hypothetical protein
MNGKTILLRYVADVPMPVGCMAFVVRNASLTRASRLVVFCPIVCSTVPEIPATSYEIHYQQFSVCSILHSLRSGHPPFKKITHIPVILWPANTLIVVALQNNSPTADQGTLVLELLYVHAGIVGQVRSFRLRPRAVRFYYPLEINRSRQARALSLNPAIGCCRDGD